MTVTRRPVPAGRRWGGLLLVLLAGVIWGTIGPAVRVVHERSALSALAIGAFRAVAAVLALLVVSLVTRRLGSSVSRARPHWRRVTVVGLLTAAFQLLYFVAVVATGVSVATVVCLGWAPVLLLVIDSVRQRRRPSPGRAATVAVALTGLLLVSLVGGSGDQVANPLGVLTAVASGSAFALATDLASTLSRRLDTLTQTTATVVVAAAALVPVGLALGHVPDDLWTRADLFSWLAIGYLGVVTIAVAYALMFTGLRSTPSGAAVVATLVEPVTAVLLAVGLLHERLTVAGAVGCGLILAAIASLGRPAADPR